MPDVDSVNYRAIINSLQSVIGYKKHLIIIVLVSYGEVDLNSWKLYFKCPEIISHRILKLVKCISFNSYSQHCVPYTVTSFERKSRIPSRS